MKNNHEKTYIHLGGNISALKNDIIGIFDLEKTTVEKSVNEFLSNAQRKGNVYYCSLDMPKSFILSGIFGENITVYVSNVAVNTLKKRIRK